MSNYTKSTNFASKDSLSTGNALKIVKGTEIDTEFNNIATAVATKADSSSPTLTGTPIAPTASAGNNSTQIATTAYADAAAAAVPDYLNTTRIDVASATTVDLTTNAPNTRHINITGTTTITGFTVAAGKTYFVRFAGILTLTNNSAIVTQVGRNIITVAGDTCIIRATAANTIEVLNYDNVTDDKQIQSISASVASNALTVTLNPTRLDFRSSTLSSGTIYTRYVQTALTLTVPSSATLGTINAVASRLTVVALDNAGTIELAIINSNSLDNTDEATLISTTAIDALSNSTNVFYSTAARSSVAFRVVGYITSTQTTAGTWASSPSIITGSAVTPSKLNPSLTLGTAQVTTSGTAINFTNVPSGVKKITILFNGVSSTGTDQYLIQIGSGSYTTTGYVSNWANTSGNATSNTTGFGIWSANSLDIHYGTFSMYTMGSNVWVASHAMGMNNTINNFFVGGGGVVTLGGTIDRFRLTTINGTDTFDAGSVNIMYE